MLNGIIKWITTSTQNLLLMFAIGGSFIGAVFFFVKDKIEDYKEHARLKKVIKQRDKALEPSKRGKRLIDSLRGK